MSRQPPATRDPVSDAATWRLDVKGADVRAGLAAAGVPSLLLKGRAFAALLYADGSPRPYVDCDLLIPFTMRERAHTVLRYMGFVPGDGAVHALEWRRYDDRMSVDLHHTLPLVQADPDYVWATLFARSTSMNVGGATTRVLDPGAAAMLAALHLVHHRPDSVRPREDLSRAIDQLDPNCWSNAADLAVQLGATAALGTGLRLVPAGVKLAERLNLPWAPSSRSLLDWNDAPWGAIVWESLAAAPSIRARVSILVELVIPSQGFLQERSALARAGPAGLILAYLLRPFRLAGKALVAVGPWRRLRRIPLEPWSN